MYSTDIANILGQDSCVAPHFLGVFGCDRLPQVTNRQSYCLISNLDESHKPGSHWICLQIVNTTCYYFCSLNTKPNAHLSNYMKQFKRIVRNRCGPQADSEITCGGYCVFVLAMLCRKQSFKSICSFFDLIKHDDAFIRYFMKEAYSYTFPPVSSF